MTSYIKFIGNGYTKDQRYQSVGSLEEIFSPLCPEDKLRYALLQSLFISYYGWLYDIRSDEFMRRYAQSLKEYIHKLDLKVDGVYATLIPILHKVIDSWYSCTWDDISIEKVVTCVIETANFNYPAMTTCAYNGSEGELEQEKNNLRSILIPYLMFRNAKLQEGYVVLNRCVAVPRFRMEGGPGNAHHNGDTPRYSVSTERIGIGFYAKFVEKQSELMGVSAMSSRTLTNYYSSLCPYLKFLTHVLFSEDRLFDGLLANISYMNQSMDEFSPRNWNSNLFYDVTVVLNDMYRIDFTSRPSSRVYESVQRYDHAREMLQFVRILCELDGFKFSHSRLFLRFFNGICRDENITRMIKFVSKYIKPTGAVPAEETLAYKRSILGGLEAIQLFSQYDSGQTESGEKAEEGQEGQDSGQLDLDPDLDIEEGAAEPGLEADDTDPSDAEADDDTTADNEQDSDDSSPSEGDAGTDDPEIEEDNSSQGDEQTNDTTSSDVQTGAAPEEIDASDVDGIPFKISPEGSETVDSVLLREEIDQFITNILVNPPKKLSPQCVAALTTLQKCWVHLLTVETLVRILDRLVAIPERFKNIITQLELKKDE